MKGENGNFVDVLRLRKMAQKEKSFGCVVSEKSQWQFSNLPSPYVPLVNICSQIFSFHNFAGAGAVAVAGNSPHMLTIGSEAEGFPFCVHFCFENLSCVITDFYLYLLLLLLLCHFLV